MEDANHIAIAATIISAVATAVIACLTLLLLFENRTLRKAGTAPELVAYLIPHKDGHGGIDFVLTNVGRGPAFDVDFKLVYDEDDFRAHEAMVFNDENRAAFTTIPQNTEQRFLFGVSYVLYGDVNGKDIGPLKPFRVIISFADITRKRHQSECTIDIRQYAGLAGILGKSSAQRIAGSLASIDKHLSVISKQTSALSLSVDATTISDARARKKKGNPPR